jgi:hypothetical protein
VAAPLVLFPDAAAAVIARVEAQLTARGHAAPVGQQTPDPRPNRFVTIFRTGGPRKNLVVDQAQLTIEAWEQRWDNAHDLLQECRMLVHAMKGGVHSGVTCYKVMELAGPAKLPDTLSTRPRYSMTMLVEVRGVAG